jgi:hypothetical protein
MKGVSFRGQGNEKVQRPRPRGADHWQLYLAIT